MSDSTTALVHHYGAKLAALYAEEIEQIDLALDDEWPDWRDKRPFAHLPLEPLKSIKWLMKRKSLIHHGYADMGIKIVMHEGKPFAGTVRPLHKVRKNPNPEFYRPFYSVPFIAAKLKTTVPKVKKALESWDGLSNPGAHVAANLPKPKVKKAKAVTDEAAQ